MNVFDNPPTFNIPPAIGSVLLPYDKTEFKFALYEAVAESPVRTPLIVRAESEFDSSTLSPIETLPPKIIAEVPEIL